MKDIHAIYPSLFPTVRGDWICYTTEAGGACGNTLLLPPGPVATLAWQVLLQQHVVQGALHLLRDLPSLGGARTRSPSTCQLQRDNGEFPNTRRHLLLGQEEETHKTVGRHWMARSVI